MKDPLQWKIVLTGTGNVAWHLGHALVEKGVKISQVLGRRPTMARELAGELQAESFGKPEDMVPDADVCLVCVSDDAIPQVLDKIKSGNCLFLHTAGSMSMDIFKGYAGNFGVLYPLQTLTKNIPVVYRRFPWLIEANSPENLILVRSLAEKISDYVIPADSRKRFLIHLAAVFAGNFTNHMYVLAERIMKENGLPFELLGPLVEETTAKAINVSPAMAQTGPASRGNKKIMDRHMALLNDHPELKEMYRMISESIGRVTRD